jgi:hypothetical protein
MVTRALHKFLRPCKCLKPELIKRVDWVNSGKFVFQLKCELTEYDVSVLTTTVQCLVSQMLMREK